MGRRRQYDIVTGRIYGKVHEAEAGGRDALGGMPCETGTSLLSPRNATGSLVPKEDYWAMGEDSTGMGV